MEVSEVTKEVIHLRIGAVLLVLCVLGVSVPVDAQSTFGSIVSVEPPVRVRMVHEARMNHVEFYKADQVVRLHVIIPSHLPPIAEPLKLLFH